MLSVDVIIVISVIGAMIGCWGCCRIVETAPRTIAACKDCCFIVIDPCVDIINKISKKCCGSNLSDNENIQPAPPELTEQKAISSISVVNANPFDTPEITSTQETSNINLMGENQLSSSDDLNL